MGSNPASPTTFLRRSRADHAPLPPDIPLGNGDRRRTSMADPENLTDSATVSRAHAYESITERNAPAAPLGLISAAGIDIGATPRSSVPAMAATPETGFLVIADLTGYTAYLSGSEIEHAPTIAGDLLETHRRPPGAAVPAGEVRGRRRLPVRRGRTGRRLAPARRDRGGLPRLPAPAPEHRPGHDLRLQLVPAGPEARPQAVRPSRHVRAQPDRRPRRAGRIGRHPRPSAAQGDRGRRRARATGSRCSRGRRRGARARSRGARPGTRRGVDRAPRSGRRPTPWTSRRAGRPRPTCAASTSATPRRCLDLDTTLAADPSVVWAHLTSPALRTRGRGRYASRKRRADGRRGVGHDEPVRHRPAGDARGDRRLAAVRPRRLAPGGTGRRSGRGRRGPRPVDAGLGCDSAGRTAAKPRRTCRRSSGSGSTRQAAFARLATVIAGALPVVEQREVVT